MSDSRNDRLVDYLMGHDAGGMMAVGGTSAATEYHDRRAVRVASPNRAALGVTEGLAPMRYTASCRCLAAPGARR
jgi:hypothetical protein